MAVGAKNSVQLEKIGAISGVQEAKIGSIGPVSFAEIIPDSVSTDWDEISFDGTGASLDSEIITINSSGTWIRSLINTGDGTAWVTSALPSSGGNMDTCTVAVQSGYEGLGRSCTLRFTVGTATADVTIIQYGMI